MAIDPSVWQIGPRVVAQVLGLPFAQYRPTAATNPIAGTPLATIPAWITRDPTLMAAKPFDRAKPDECYAGLDVTLTARGDYLVGSLVVGDPAETFFIASQDVPAPIRLVLCDRVLSFSRPAATSGGYSAREAATDTPLASGWPAAIIQGTKGDANPAGLPSDVRAPWVAIYLPGIPGVTLEYGDAAQDDLGRSYILSNVELTRFGYRISASYAGA